MPEQRIIEETIYTFDELSEDGKQKAREIVGTWLAEWQNECLEDTFGWYLEEQGFPTNDIKWSLSSSQGDGVAFYGSIDLEKWMKVNKRLTYYRLIRPFDLYARIDRNSWGTHYSHYNTMDVIAGGSFRSEFWPFDPLVNTERRDQLLEELREELEEAVRDMSRKLEKIGYDAFEYAYSEEAVREACEASEYRFYEDGRVA